MMKTMRDGFALPVSLLVMIVIGAIVTGGFYASRQDAQISGSSELASEAFQVAEYGLEEAIGTWTNAQVMSGSWEPEGYVTTPSGARLGRYSRDVVPLGAGKFLVSSDGVVAKGGRAGARRLGVLVETTDGVLPYTSALTVFGQMSAKGNSTIDGTDTAGPGSVCPAGSGMVAGVTVASSGAVSGSGSAEILGDPPEQVEPDMTRDRLNDLGPIQVSDLVASATKTFSPGSTLNGIGPVTRVDANGQTVCDESPETNWGDPGGSGPCTYLMPIIHAQGNLSITGGTGQGILIVEGDLNAAGGFSFYGITIVKGTLKTAGTGAHFNGTVIVQGDGDLNSESTQTGNSVVSYSQCRVQRAFDAALRIRPLANRSWIDLSGVGSFSS